MARPNFLIVVVDSAQAGAYAVNGGQARAPHVERIAREGMRFTNAAVHSWYPFRQRGGIVAGTRGSGTCRTYAGSTMFLPHRHGRH